MAGGFHAVETIGRAPAEVWARLTDFARAGDWMTGVSNVTRLTDGPLAVGSRLRFTSRGAIHETEVTALDHGCRIDLTSTQGGITATYSYRLAPEGAGTRATLDAACEARGLWRLIHPLIAYAMRRADSGQLARLKATFEED